MLTPDRIEAWRRTAAVGATKGSPSGSALLDACDEIQRLQAELPKCNGMCLHASDVGVSVDGDPVAYEHRSCPEHGDLETVAQELNAALTTAEAERDLLRAELVKRESLDGASLAKLRERIEAVIEDDHEDEATLAAMIVDRVVDPIRAAGQRWHDTYQSEVNTRDEFFGELLKLLPGAEDAGMDAYDQIPRGIEALRTRLKAAEDTCVMLGWSAARHEGDREKATHELWSRWANIVGSAFLAREAHPDLSREEIVRLAAQRDETRARTLARIRSDHPGVLPGGEG